MGALGKARVFLWLFTIVIMLAGSMGMIIYNNPLQLKGLGNKTIAGKVWFNAVIALHAVYLIGVGFEIISRAYLMMVGSTCSEQRRVFLCCFLYSMTAWWKLMMILSVITFIILGGITALIIILEGFPKINIIRLAITDGVSLVEILFSALSFVSSRKIQNRQDEEEERLHGNKPAPAQAKTSDKTSASSDPPCVIQEKSESSAKSSEQPSAIMPA